MTATLYLTRNGLLEPLGQSQVLSYLGGLAKDFRITLITHEKSADFGNRAEVERMAAHCRSLGIRWLPQVFRERRSILADVTDFLRLCVLVMREARSTDARLIHARSYIPAIVALAVSPLCRVPFIFDMRGLWPEERITAGRMRRGSVLHRVLLALERRCLHSAGTVVSLTNAALVHLNSVYPREMQGKKTAVIPTCADLGRFSPAPVGAGAPVFGCLGTVLSGWFRTDLLSAFMSVVARHEPDARFAITTRDDPALVRQALALPPDLGSRVTVGGAAFCDVHEVIQGQTASIFFYAQGMTSELGRSPTRFAEVLGCGVPVVTNGGVGDVAEIVQRYRVGVILKSNAAEHVEAAWQELQKLLADPQLSARCRAAAEEVYSLDAGIAAFADIYRDLAAVA